MARQMPGKWSQGGGPSGGATSGIPIRSTTGQTGTAKSGRTLSSQNTNAKTYTTASPPSAARVAAGRRLAAQQKRKFRGQGAVLGAAAGVAVTKGAYIVAGGSEGKKKKSTQRPVSNATTKVKSGKYAGKRVPKGNG